MEEICDPVCPGTTFFDVSFLSGCAVDLEVRDHDLEVWDQSWKKR